MRWVFVLFLFTFTLIAQEKKKIHIRHTDLIKGGSKLGYQRLLGNVLIQHKNLILESDSAYFYSGANKMKAYSNVYLHQADSLSLYADSLLYDGDSEVAKAFGDVVLESDSLILTTEELRYDRLHKKFYYPNSGTVKDSTNTLESVEGFYELEKKQFYFYQDVHMYNENYDAFTDTLLYYTEDKIAYFYGPTDIIHGKDSAFAGQGKYYSEKGILYASISSQAVYDRQTIKADSLFYDKVKKVGEAWNQVELIDSTQKTIIRGDYSYFDNKNKHSLFTKEPYMTQVNEGDSLFIHGDTIYAKQTKDSSRTVYFYPDVKIFSEELQGKSDSLIYQEKRSELRMKGSPVIWMTDGHQLTSDTILIKISQKEKKVKEIHLLNHAIMIQQDEYDTTATQFNQVEGRKMVAYFKDNELTYIQVDGNAKAIYYLYSQDTIDPLLHGINKISCGAIRIDFAAKKVRKATFFIQPEAEVYPPHMLPQNVRRLKTFFWRNDEKPLSKEDIFSSSLPLDSLYPSLKKNKILPQ